LASFAAAAALAGCNAVFGVVPGELAEGAGAGGAAASTTGATGGGPGPGGGGAGPVCGAEGGPYTGELRWASKSYGSTYAVAAAVALGTRGDVIVTGRYTGGSIAFGADTIPHSENVSENDLFLASYGLDTGAALWGKGFPADDEQLPRALAVDPSSGDIVVGGHMGGSVSFGDGAPVLTGGGDGYPDAFVARFDHAGEHVWSRTFSAAGYQETIALAADDAGNALIGVVGEGALDLGDAVRGSAQSWGLYLVKVDPAGQTLWSRYYETSYFEEPTVGLAFDAEGNIAVTTAASGAVWNSPDSWHGAMDVVVAKLDPAGTYLWSRLFGGTQAEEASSGNQRGVAVTFDCHGDVLVTGAFEVDLRFDGLPVLTAVDGDDVFQGDAFLAKLRGSDGQAVWARAFGDQGLQIGQSVGTDATGNVVLSGTLYDDVDAQGISFGGGTLAPSPPDGDTYREDLFLAKYTPDGDHLWSRRFGDQFIQEGRTVVEPVTGRIAAAGDFFFGIVFDGTVDGTLTDEERDLFVATFDP
jgi:hypothetical protein